MGMFAKEYKQPIPKYAMCIGVVTAPTGAAIQDIRNISSRRNPYVQMILYPALVQGENAAASIVNGIHALDKQNVDVIIIGRGGGSIEDLWAFNEEIVARAIFDCSIPIISAVGHETDWTIADFVADMRAPTPSAAAELAVFDYMQVEMQLRECKRRMDISLRRRLELSRERLAHLKTQMTYLSPQSRLNDNRRRLMEVEERLCLYMKQKMQECRHRLSILVEKLDANSPTKKLSGGFAYVQTSERKPLLTISQVSPEENIKIYLADGSVDAKVLEVKKHE